MKNKLMTLALVAGLVWGCVTEAKAVEFKAAGQFLMGYGGNEATFQQDHKGGNDIFQAGQRVRLQLEAIVSESLSGTVQFEMGDTIWGNGETGGALGADGKIVELMSAYIDWYVPNTELQFRMGIFGAAMPNAAGGSAVFDEQVAGIVANYPFNDNIGLTLMWLRPFNDNYVHDSDTAWEDRATNDSSNYLDNADYFMLSLPMSFDGFDITPWVMYGAVGRNSELGELGDSMPVNMNTARTRFWGEGTANNWRMENAYGSQIYAGIPIVISALDPWNFEFDINYGASYGFGNYSVWGLNDKFERASADRSGWVVKALAEYSFDWGRPGLFAWYASGDDGDLDNGSERMPTITGTGNFTSFFQDGYGWGALGESGLKVTYDGTWAIGLQLADFSFMEDLSHTFRVAYIGGTNSPEMMQYVDGKGWGGMYLTTQDYLVELNFDTTWQIYENLQAVVEVGYIFNGFNTDEWNNAGGEPEGWGGKADAWKANLIFAYEF